MKEHSGKFGLQDSNMQGLEWVPSF